MHRTGVPGGSGNTRSFFQATLLTISLLIQLSASASGPYRPIRGEVATYLNAVPVAADSISRRDPRATAAVLAALLGPFGAHRLHLGTSPKVVVIYGATLGGFGVLPLIDLGHLLFARDQERFRNNDKLLMWR